MLLLLCHTDMMPVAECPGRRQQTVVTMMTGTLLPWLWRLLVLVATWWLALDVIFHTIRPFSYHSAS
jgi:hypothetical protein